MKRFWLLLVLLSVSCRSERSIDLTSLVPFAETNPDTEVLLFAAPKAQNFLVSWSEPKRQSGGRYRWSETDHPSFSWNLALPAPAFLHLRAAASESFPMVVHFGNESSKHWLERNSSVQVIPFANQATTAEFRIPGSAKLGVHSAVISRSRNVVEFRKPGPFPSVEQFRWRGKKRSGLFFETGGAISFYERITPQTVLELGYYFAPSNKVENDSARFSVYLRGPGGRPGKKPIFQRQVSQLVYERIRIPLRTAVATFEKPEPHQFEFMIERETAFGDGKTAWIEPELHGAGGRSLKPGPVASAAVRKSMAGANILLIILDAASVRRFGCYGYGRGTTPEIDQISKEGVLFQRAYTNAVYTLASSATTLTGQFPFRHGVLHHRNRLPAAAVTLPEKLQSGGYDTAAFLANGNVSTAFGLTQGFRTLREVFRDRNYIGRAEDITATFSDWLKSREDRPFFAYLHYREPHDPYQPPLEWVKRFADAGYSGVVLKNFKDKKPIEENDPTYTREDREFISSLYDANLAYGDSEVGKVLRLLKQQNLDHRTMIIVTSDHGEAFWEHGYQGHNLQLYEESARVPMIIRFPGETGLRGIKIEFPVQHADLYATIVDLLGVSFRGMKTDGIRLTPWLMGGTPPDREILLQSTRRPRNALVLGDYKYIENGDGTNELYNLKTDPMERMNRIDVEPVRAGYLRQVLLKKLYSSDAKKVETEAAELDDAARENLKALGYLD